MTRIIDIQPEGKTVRLTTGSLFGWDIREYRRTDGLGGGFTYLYDAAEVDGPGLSPGFDTYDEAVEYVRSVRRQLHDARRNADPSALRRAFG